MGSHEPEDLVEFERDKKLEFYSVLPDVVRASIYAIHVLTESARTHQGGDGPVEAESAHSGEGTPDETGKANYPTPDNFERDKWVYEQRKARKTIPDIIQELETNTHGWEPLYSDTGIRDAARRYAEHLGVSPPKGKPGRPRGR